MTEPDRNGESKALATKQEPKPGYHPVADVPHYPRTTDTNPRAAKRAERQVAILFSLSVLLVIAFIAVFITVPNDVFIRIPGLGDVGALHVGLGVTLGGAILCIGLGAIHWAKKLMTDVEVVQERHVIKSTEKDTDEALAVFEAGTEQSGFTKFPLIRRTMLAALALVPLPFVVVLRELWPTPPEGTPHPVTFLEETLWKEGMRLVTDITYQPIKASDVPVGGLVNVVPATLPEVEEEEHNLNARAKAAAMVVRMRPEQIVSEQGDGWSYQGILAFSKICTHVGCPISLYEQRTHHLLCPCHQSTFDLADSGNVIFGPAARRMPQLPIGVDDEGYLIALSDFQEPVGPSYWERGNA